MNSIKIVITIIIVLIGFYSFSQKVTSQKSEKLKEIKIETSAQCEMCKERIEKDMAFVNGVKEVKLDLETMILSVKYKISKTDTNKIRKAVSKIGYDADDVEADKEAYKKLPKCCQKGGHDIN